MHIKVLKTRYIDGMFFVKDEIRDVDGAVLERIGNEKLGDARLLYEEVPAPWDAQKDEKAVQVAELQARIAKAADELERLEDEAFGMTYRRGPGEHGLTAAVENADHDREKAEQLFRQIEARADKAAKRADKHPTEVNEKKAVELADEVLKASLAVDEKCCLAHKARAQLLLLDADIGLAELEVAKARAELAVMRNELYELRPDLKPKEDEDGPTKKTEAPDGSGQPGGKDAADAKGQTDAPGQTAAVQD